MVALKTSSPPPDAKIMRAGVADFSAGTAKLFVGAAGAVRCGPLPPVSHGLASAAAAAAALSVCAALL